MLILSYIKCIISTVSGSWTSEALGWEERSWTRGGPESHRGTQQLHQDGQSKAGAKNGD